MSRNAHNWMNTTFNKHHKVSHRPSHKLHHHFWGEVWTIKVIKYPPYCYPGRVINSSLNPHLKITQTQILTLKLQTGSLRLDLVGHFMTLTKTECSLIMCINFVDISEIKLLGKGLINTSVIGKEQGTVCLSVGLIKSCCVMLFIIIFSNINIFVIL